MIISRGIGMPRQSYIFCRDTQKMVPVEEYYAKHQRATSSAPYVIQDSMDAAAHPCTGKMMDSKSEFRKVTRAHGCTEMGNESLSSYGGEKEKLDPGKRREAIKRAMIENGVKW
jgi:hypothetical protein